MRLLFPVEVQSPNHVVQRFVTHTHLRGECLFLEFHERTAQLEVLREVVSPVHTNHRLSHGAVFRCAFHARPDVSVGIEDALVENRHFTERVVHLVVSAFGEGDTTRCDNHRTLWDVHRTEVDFASARTFVFSHQGEFILFRYLFCHDLGRVVQCIVAILVGNGIITNLLS